MSSALEIREQLQALKPGLEKKYSIAYLGLFGSILRSDFSPSSDVDILVDFKEAIGIEFIDLANELEEQLHRKVDLVSRNAIKEKYYCAIEHEIEYVQ
jgi:predicted nucleotidyltransferase